MDPEISNQSISSLTPDANYLLSCLLNPVKVLLTERGINRDWRGVAQRAKLSREDITYIKEQKSIFCIAKVFDLWLKKKKETALIGRLCEIVREIDRHDVYDDLLKLHRMGQLINVTTYISNAITRPLNSLEDCETLTYDDMQYGIQTYHAFVLYAPQNLNVLIDIKNEMDKHGKKEGTQIKICTKDDLLPGQCTPYVPVSKLIMERCRHILVLCSPYFFNDPANQYFINYSQAVSIDKKPDFLIPIVIDDYQLTGNLKYITQLEYKPGHRLSYDFSKKLYLTICGPRVTNSLNCMVSQNIASPSMTETVPLNLKMDEKPNTSKQNTNVVRFNCKIGNTDVSTSDILEKLQLEQNVDPCICNINENDIDKNETSLKRLNINGINMKQTDTNNKIVKQIENAAKILNNAKKQNESGSESLFTNLKKPFQRVFKLRKRKQGNDANKPKVPVAKSF